MNQNKPAISPAKKPSLIINGIHLHSKIDPIKEAEAFCEKYEKEIAESNSFMVLGLAYGYHINALVKTLLKHDENLNIFIIEPNKELIQEYKNNFPQFFDIPGLHIFSNEISELYYDPTFVSALIEKPAILVHQASYEANKEYFKSFLTFKASEDIKEYEKHIHPELFSLLYRFRKSNNWIDYKNSIKKENYDIETAFWAIYSKI